MYLLIYFWLALGLFLLTFYFVLEYSSVGKESTCNAGDPVRSLGWEDPLEEGKATHSSILACRIPWDCKESDTTERLSLSQLISNVVIVSGEQQRDSAKCIHVSILPQAPLPSRLPHNIEQSSLSYTVSRFLLVIHFKYNSMYNCIISF